MLSAVLAAALSFAEAQPVWPEEAQAKNSFVGFHCSFAAKQGEQHFLRMTGASIARVFLNGRHAGYGSARGPKGWARVDEWPLAVQEGVNHIALEVAGYRVSSYYHMNEEPFLQAEIVDGRGNVLAATGKDFSARRLDRVVKCSRMSFQRTFGEAYRVGRRTDAWRTAGIPTGERLKLSRRGAVALLPRRAPYPRFEMAAARLVRSAKFVYDPNGEWKGERFVNKIGPLIGGYLPEELEVNIWAEIQRIKEVAAGSCRGAYFEFDTVRSGFPSITLRCAKPGRLVLLFGETLTDTGSIDPTRNQIANGVVWDIAEAGDYTLETFEPYTMRHLAAVCISGEMEFISVAMREYKNPAAAKYTFCSDDAQLCKVFEAARETFAQNAVDLFTDCPSRERAGFCCDSYFTARSSLLFCGSTDLEKAFLENYLLPERFDNIPQGMFPMCYPADFPNGNYIPNWAMWLVLQVEEYLERSGDKELVEAFRPKFEKMAEFLFGFSNDDGLLENLPKWVYVDGSEANNFTKGVNYPSNMLWAETLDALSRMYNRADFAAKAAHIRDIVRKQSFDGQWFRDHALRGADGTLVLQKPHTEAAQYYAFFFRAATNESHPELWKRLVRDFGPDRAEKGLYPEMQPCNILIGTFLRLECLCRAGLGAQAVEEAKGYFGYMASKTGTLWEYNDAQKASYCHGFASHVACLFVRELEKGKKK